MTANIGATENVIPFASERMRTARAAKNRRIYEALRGYEANRKNTQEMEKKPRIRAGGVW